MATKTRPVSKPVVKTQEQLDAMREELALALAESYADLIGANIDEVFAHVEAENEGKSLRKLVIRAHRAGKTKSEKTGAELNSIVVDDIQMRLAKPRAGAEGEDEEVEE